MVGNVTLSGSGINNALVGIWDINNSAMYTTTTTNSSGYWTVRINNNSCYAPFSFHPSDQTKDGDIDPYVCVP